MAWSEETTRVIGRLHLTLTRLAAEGLTASLVMMPESCCPDIRAEMPPVQTLLCVPVVWTPMVLEPYVCVRVS